MPANTLDFKCPACGDNTLEEAAKAITYTTISNFYRYNSTGRYHSEYNDTETEYLETIRSQCFNCGFEVYDGSCDDIAQHCIDKGWIEGMEEVPDWEV